MTEDRTCATRSASAQRLHKALATMVRQQGGSDASTPLTASALCELAGISRNALYRYHPDVVHALHAAQQKHRHRPDAARQAACRLREDNAILREQLAQLVALVDHYFAAWQETSLLLQRRERELADLRRDTKARVVPIARQ